MFKKAKKKFLKKTKPVRQSPVFKVGKKTLEQLDEKKVNLLAAGIAYFSSLAFFPVLAAAVAIAALVISPDQVVQVADAISKYLPKDIASLVMTQLEQEASSTDGGSSLIVLGIAAALSLFSASSAVENLIKALNVIFDVEVSRNIVRLKLLSFLITLGVVLGGFVIAVTLALNKTILEGIGVPDELLFIWPVLRWIILAVIIMTGLALLYFIGPNLPKKKRQFRWISAGSAIASVLWLIGTSLFFLYIQNFAGATQSYSLYAGIIVMMIWLNLSAFIVLLGATINSVLYNKKSRY